MTGDLTIRKDVQLAHVNGLHLTPIQLLVKRATGFQSEVKVLFDGKTANAKSAMDLLLLGATCGSTMTIEATGPDCEEAVEAAIQVLSTE